MDAKQILSNITFSALIMAMREIIHNNERYCFSDLLCDLEEIAKTQEQTNAFIIYWGVRRNGTKIAAFQNDIEEWAKICSNFQYMYKIVLKNGLYSIDKI